GSVAVPPGLRRGSRGAPREPPPRAPPRLRGRSPLRRVRSWLGECLGERPSFPSRGRAGRPIRRGCSGRSLTPGDTIAPRVVSVSSAVYESPPPGRARYLLLSLGRDGSLLRDPLDAAAHPGLRLDHLR